MRQCANCNEKTDKRIECNICDLLVGLECLGDYQGELLEHDSHGHKTMTFYVTPDCFTPWQVNPECTSCIVGSSVAHCGLCLEARVSDGLSARVTLELGNRGTLYANSACLI